MKRILLLLAVTLTIVSCRSVHKYVKKGDYDKAIDLALTKLRKHKNLKRQDVRALEYAFKRIRTQEEQRILRMYSSRHSSWTNIRNSVKTIDKAQKRIKAYMPIVSKEGYKATFNFINVGRLQEVALTEANNRDLEEIGVLVKGQDPKDYYKVFTLYERIKARQELVASTPSIVGVEGYVPKFSYADIGSRLEKVKRKAAQHEYSRAESMLDIARKGDKKAARRAYELYHKVLDIDSQYSNTRSRIDEAKQLGTVDVLFRVKNSSHVLVPRALESMVYDSNLKDIGGKWTRIHMDGRREDMDVLATFDILALEISPNIEDVDIDRMSDRIHDGYEYELDANGNVKKDTSGNDIKVKRYVDISGEWHTINRKKSGTIAGKVTYLNLNTRDRFHSKPIDVSYVFEDEAYNYRGDDRLLTKQMKYDLDKRPKPFPSEHFILLESSNILIEALKKELDQMVFNTRWYE